MLSREILVLGDFLVRDIFSAWFILDFQIRGTSKPNCDDCMPASNGDEDDFGMWVGCCDR